MNGSPLPVISQSALHPVARMIDCRAVSFGSEPLNIRKTYPFESEHFSSKRKLFSSFIKSCNLFANGVLGFVCLMFGAINFALSKN